MSDPTARRGEVWLAHTDKLRPVVVLTRDPLGAMLHAVVVGPVTTRVRGLSTEVAVGPEEGVARPSVVNLDSIQLLERSRLRRRIGHVGPGAMERICRAVAIGIGCDDDSVA